jgi:hypothetical protein
VTDSTSETDVRLKKDEYMVLEENGHLFAVMHEKPGCAVVAGNHKPSEKVTMEPHFRH